MIDGAAHSRFRWASASGKRIWGIAISAALCAPFATAASQTRAPAAADALVAALTYADGGRTTIETTREPSGRVNVVVRGRSYDGRRFLKALLGHLSAKEATVSVLDINLDIKVARFAGFNGEALRNFELKLTAQGGEIREFGLTAKLGANANVKGELRTGSRRTLYLEAGDAGAFFRFFNVYQRMQGGRVQMAVDALASDHALRGAVNVSDFVVTGEPALVSIIGPPAKRDHRARKRVEFSSLRFEFKMSQGDAIESEGVISGPTFGATLTGKIDFAENKIKLRGIVVPLQQLDRALMVVPGEREGLFYLSYAILGSLKAPVLQINPATPLTPGILRKLFESKADDGNLGR